MRTGEVIFVKINKKNFGKSSLQADHMLHHSADRTFSGREAGRGLVRNHRPRPHPIQLMGLCQASRNRIPLGPEKSVDPLSVQRRSFMGGYNCSVELHVAGTMTKRPATYGKCSLAETRLYRRKLVVELVGVTIRNCCSGVGSMLPLETLNY